MKKLLSLLCLSGLLAALTSAAAAEPARVSVQVDAAHPGREIPPGFLGFSREWRHFVPPDGGPAEAIHPVYLRLIEQLSRFNAQGVCFRIGGNSADGMGASPEPARWKQIAQLYGVTHMPVIINLNLAREDAALDRAMILDAQKELPSGAVLAFELGNEPDGWAGRYRPADYTFSQYLPAFERIGRQLSPELVPGFAGPAYAHGAAVAPLQEFLTAEKGLVNLVTFHSYRFDPKSHPKVERLLDERDTAGFAQRMAEGIRLAHEAGLKIRMTEAGSAWGGGAAGFSDSFGASLWTLDVLFETARAGLDGIHFHGGGMSNYTPIREEDDKASKHAIITARAPFYGMLVFAEAVSARARLLPATADGSAKVKVWATLGQDGVMRLALINKELEKPVRFEITGLTKEAAIKRLLAPALSATEGISFDGQTYDHSPDGNPVGQPSAETIKPEHGVLSIELAPASAALLQLR